MKKLIFLLLFCAGVHQYIFCQTAKELQETARSFMQQGDYTNAILVLNRAIQMEPQNLDISKDLSLSYYIKRDNAKALEIIKPLLDREDADDQCFQIASNIYKQLQQPKESDKVYRRGLKKFPTSGPLYNDLGELLWEQNDYNAIKQWEKGIEVDPGFSRNYYNASKYYFFTTDKIWSILYGETFINLEPFSNRTPEIKSLLLESYKKLFAATEIVLPPAAAKNKFLEAYVKTMSKQNVVATTGINTETLTMIRTRFILDWYQDYADKFPFKLFELHRQLLQEGMFDAYNQWVFESVQNLAAYQNWTVLHAGDYNEFTRFQKSRLYKIPAGQYHNFIEVK
jgi:tetratricopeptide (TPR) repeat protein